jgi:phosphoribosylformimino-5-aminoimidazole carboxamide ribotide isomerase
MKIIPAIDIIDGKCVRLTQGDYAQKKIYNENPLDVAKSFEDAGLKYLHLVDLDGAKAGKVVNWNVIENICNNTSLIVDFGGGVKTKDDIQKLLDKGVSQINLGSIAVKDKTLVYDWIETFGADKIILSADVKDEMIAIHGWQDNSGIPIVGFIQDYLKNGIHTITCTDIRTDGMLAGPNIDLYKKLILLFPAVDFIASGGVSSMEDIDKLRVAGVDGVIVGKAIYEGHIKIEELSF